MKSDDKKRRLSVSRLFFSPTHKRDDDDAEIWNWLDSLPAKSVISDHELPGPENATSASEHDLWDWLDQLPAKAVIHSPSTNVQIYPSPDSVPTDSWGRFPRYPREALMALSQPALFAREFLSISDRVREVAAYRLKNLRPPDNYLSFYAVSLLSWFFAAFSITYVSQISAPIPDTFLLSLLGFSATVAQTELARRSRRLIIRRSGQGIKSGFWLSKGAVTLICAQITSLPLLEVALSVTGSVFSVAGIAVISLQAMAVAMILIFIWSSVADLKKIQPRVQTRNQKHVIVFGAGAWGQQIITAMLDNDDCEYSPVAVMDDRKQQGLRPNVRGVPIYGGRNEISKVAKTKRADILLIAMRNPSPVLILDLMAIGRESNLDVRVLPSINEILVGTPEVKDIRKVDDCDILERQSQSPKLDVDAIRGLLHGKSVLITGAGSIGSGLLTLITTFRPSQIFVLDRDESALHCLHRLIQAERFNTKVSLLMADTVDQYSIDTIFETNQFDIVFHSALLKNHPLLEKSPRQALRVNVQGTYNVLQAARRTGVGRFVNISSDKAESPMSVYDATMMAAERLTSRVAKEANLNYFSIRVGNLLSSRVSVLSTFRDQIEHGGPVTVTSPQASRHFVTIPEASGLILDGGSIGGVGEILTLDMGDPVKIYDIAKQLISMSGRDIAIVFSGARFSGERVSVSNSQSAIPDRAKRISSESRLYRMPGQTEIEFDSLPLYEDDLKAMLAHLLNQLTNGDCDRIRS